MRQCMKFKIKILNCQMVLGQLGLCVNIKTDSIESDLGPLNDHKFEMNSSVPNEKEKTPQTTTGQAPMVLPSDSQPATNPPPASDSDSSKGGGAPQQSGQYVVGVPPQQGEIPTWSTGLFECFDDLPTPCFVYAALYAGIMYLTGCGCLLSAYYRIKMTQIYNLPNDPIINILVHLICEPCALCQEYRELQAHGFNMQLGNELGGEINLPKYNKAVESWYHLQFLEGCLVEKQAKSNHFWDIEELDICLLQTIKKINE
uniref:Uncharacterized protein n=1 Tax=Lactuca sativa TaxID=4236 RepID=A0A9R1UU30_LACSA|nr:hypothetical protein LSAT_V11C800406920 [Lactuca sativa]